MQRLIRVVAYRVYEKLSPPKGIICYDKLMNKHKHTSRQSISLTLQHVFAGLGAILSLVSGALHYHHIMVVSYRPQDISDTIGIWLFLLSLGFWTAWLATVVWRTVKQSAKPQCRGR